MSGNGNQVPLAPNQRGPGPYPRASTPHRPVECYHPSGAAGSAYMPSTAGGAQSSAQATLRAQTAPQPSAPPAPQQDMSKTTMGGHNYVSQNQTQQQQQQQQRPQYPNFQYRAAQHGSRPNTHPRQQQPFIPNAAASATGPMMYPALVFQPHMGMQTYQQPRSSAPGYYPYHHYISYNTPPSHSSPYYYTPNSPQLPTPNLQTNASGGRSNPTTLVGPQGTPATPSAPTVSLPHAQAPTHMHQSLPGLRPAVTKRVSHRLAIIDPVTQQDIFSDLYTNDSSYMSGEPNDRQTPQPEPTAAEVFARMVSEVANQPCESAVKSNYVPKQIDIPISSTTSNVQPQHNAINSINNNVVKSEILNIIENKTLGPDVAVESNETPIVSAISDSPVIVPKMPINIKQIQKNCEQTIQPLVLDTNKNIPPNKHHKQSKNKPVVPQIEELEKTTENVTILCTNTSSSTAPVVVSQSVLALAPSFATMSVPAPAAAAPPTVYTPAPQPQRIRESRERLKSQEKDSSPTYVIPNGPTQPAPISSADSLSRAINSPTSQINQPFSVETYKNPAQQLTSALENRRYMSNVVKDDTSLKQPVTAPQVLQPTATQLLSASIERFAKELPAVEETFEIDETCCATEAQAKLTLSLSSVLRSNQSASKMKDINLNNKTPDPDTANGNTTDVTKTEPVKDEINKNEKVVKSTKGNKKASKMANCDDPSTKEGDSHESTKNNKKTAKVASNDEATTKEADLEENGKDETDKIAMNVELDLPQPAQDESSLSDPIKTSDSSAAPAFVPKYKYSDDQWSPLNKSGKKYYDIGLLKQIKEDPLSKNKPNAPLLEVCNVIRTTPMQEPLAFSTITRPMNDSFLFPQFAKGAGIGGSRNNTPRDAKKDGRNIAPAGKGSVKSPLPSSGSSHGKQVIHVSLSLREEVKLNEVDSAWKPTRFRRDSLNEGEHKTQELYKKFRGILNKLTPQKFDTLLDRVKHLEINNQKRLEGVIDLVFEKAIDEPNFSEAYAAMCNKLSTLKVPADNASSPDQCVNFRALIINKCQQQFEADKVDEQVLKLEKDLAECSDPVKKKELQLMIVEESRRIRMRSVGNVRFIGELYKLKMLTSKIMDYCMKYLIDKIEEEKLECLCKLLTTIGEQVENEVSGQLDAIFKKMQDIVERRSNKISSRVRFMIQDVIELRRRKWVVKSVVDSQPKMMDQIQKEAEQHQRHIELMNANPMGGFRREEGGRGKRGGDRRQNNNNSFMDNQWKTPRSNFPVDTLKLKAVTQNSQKNLTNIKLAPQNSGWNHGSGTKNTAQVGAGSNSMISLSKNMYSVLENVQTDPTSLRGNRDMTPSYHAKGASIERSTFNSRGDFTSGGRSGSVGVARSNSGTRSTSSVPPAPAVAAEVPPPAPTTVRQEPLPDAKKKSVKSMIDLFLINPDDEEMVAEVKQIFPPQYHAAVVTEILNVALEKSAKEVGMITKSLLHLVSTNTISAENLLSGMKEIFEFAPDLYIDIPLLYEYLGNIVALHIEKKHITFAQVFSLCESIIASNQGHLLLKAIITDLNDSMGPTFLKSKWQESNLQLNQWMNEDQVSKWIVDNKFEYLEGGSKANEDTKFNLSPSQTQSKVLQLLNSDESCDCIKGWILDKFGKSANEDWCMRALIQAICEHALFGPEVREVPHFNQDRMNKYIGLINEFGESKQSREASCLFGIQQLIHRLEHPQGLTLEIFQYLHEQYIISLDGFIAWEESEMEPEGKGVMMKALTSFFTNIKEADNEDSCSED